MRWIIERSKRHVFKLEEITPAEEAAYDPERIAKSGNRVFKLNDKDLVVKLNTVIVKGYSINHVTDLIRKHAKNARGPEISETFKP